MQRAGWAGLIAVVIAIVILDLRRGDDDDAPVAVSAHGGTPRPAATPRPALQAEVAPAADGGPASRLEGRVIGPDGAAVEGAVVALEAPARTVTSAADGRFRFADLEPGAYAIVATARALIAGPIRHVVTGTSRPLVIRLAEAAFADLVLTDELRQPIANAQVVVRSGAQRWELSTGAGGKVTFGPSQSGSMSLDVAVAGYAPSLKSLAIGPGTENGETAIVLYRGTPVSGRVVDDSRAPIPNARVTVIGRGYERYATIRVDERGAFAIPALARGDYTLRARDDDHGPAASAPIHVAGAPIEGIEIVLFEGGTAAGVVLDHERRPAPFAVVSVYDWFAGQREVVAGEDGAFEVRGLPRKQTSLRAATSAAASDPVAIDLSRNPRATVEIVLASSGTIAGTVVDERGAPAAGVTVAGQLDSKRVLGPPRYGLLEPVITDEAGAFIVHVIAGAPYLLEARRRASGGMQLGTATTPARDGDRDVRLTLLRDGELTGRVVLDDGDAPPQEVTVTVANAGGIAVNRDGTFHIKGIPPGNHPVHFHSPDFAPLSNAGVRIAPGATTDLGVVTPMRNRTLHGRVVDGTGAPVGGARVEVGVIRDEPIDEDDPPAGFKAYRTVVAAPDGSFRVTDLPPAALTARATAPTHGVSATAPVPGAAEVGPYPPAVTLVLPAADR